MAQAEITAKMCTKCGAEPRVDQGDDATNRHCTKCKTKAHRAYQMSKLEQQHGKGYGAGVRAMREVVVDLFDGYASGNFSGYEIAGMVRVCEVPLPSETEEEKAVGK